jgi:hypothetical protein
VEDQAIAEIVKFQQDVGLKSITDGEFRRTYFHIDFLEQLGGVKTDVPVTIRKPTAPRNCAAVIRVTDKVRHAKDIQKADFEYLKSQVGAGRTPKVTIPSPTMLHFRGGRAGISKEAYPELEPAFYDDVAQAYGDELRSLHDAGCRYVQMDDTNLAYLCDEKMREAARQRGDDPNELPHRYAKFINKVVAQKPRACCWPCTCAAATSRAPSPPPATTSRSPRRCSRRWTSTPTSWSTTTTVPATSGRCATCPRARRWCWGWSPPSSASWKARTTSSAASTRPPGTHRWSSSRCRRSAASPAPCTQQHRGGRPAQQAQAGGGNGAGSLGRQVAGRCTLAIHRREPRHAHPTHLPGRRARRGLPAAAQGGRMQTWKLATSRRTGIHDVARRPTAASGSARRRAGTSAGSSRRPAARAVALGWRSAPHGVIQGPDLAACLTDGGQNADRRVWLAGSR